MALLALAIGESSPPLVKASAKAVSADSNSPAARAVPFGG
jgi:hypothetical protein